MDLTGHCQHCAQSFSFPSNMVGDFADCPHCGQNTVLQATAASPVPHAPASSAPSAVVTPAPALVAPPVAAQAASTAATMPVQAYESPEQYLKRIREHTCYEALRGVIAFITTLLIGVAIFVSLAGVAALVLQGQPGFNSSSQGVVIGMAVGSFFASALIIVFALAAKQSMSLLVDIADISLEANRRK